MRTAARRRTDPELDGSRPEQPARPAAPAPAALLQLQRTAGNQAVGRMLHRFSMDQVIEHFTGDVGLLDAKIKARSAEIGGGDENAKKAQATREVQNALKHLERIEAGTIITLPEWQEMRAGLASEEYARALRAFNDWKGKPEDKQKFLASVPDESTGLGLFTGNIARRDPALAKGKKLGEQIEATANAARAKQALKEIDAVKNKTRQSRTRITEPIVELLVWGVAEPRSKDALGSEGLIGIIHAVAAAQALAEMPQTAYLDIVLRLATTGVEGGEGDWKQRRTESVLILKAVAARKDSYIKGSQESQAAVGKFAGDIRGQNADTLADKASGRDVGGALGGLQQRFTMSCGPTTWQIISAEGDPIFALAVDKAGGKQSLEYKSGVAKQQEQKLGKPVAPRNLKPRWDQFVKALNTIVLPPESVAAWSAFLKDFVGQAAPDPTLIPQGRAIAEGLGFTSAEIDDFKRYRTGLITQPGLNANEVETLMQSLGTLAKGGAVRHDNPKGTAVSDAQLDEMWQVLFRGRDIPIGVLWPKGGGHVMSFTDCKGKPPTGGAGRTFLLTDPWDGKSEWLNSAQIKAGTFGAHGTGHLALMFY